MTSSVSPTPTERLEAAAGKLEQRAEHLETVVRYSRSAGWRTRWTREAAESRAVAEWLRSESKIRTLFVPFIELVVAFSVERNDGLIDEMSLKRDGDGNLLFDADTSEHALAVADAVLGEQP